MALASEIIAELARYLDTAEMERREVTKITDQHPEMDWDDAYAIQAALRQRQQARGIGMAGYKAMLANMLGRRGGSLPAGAFIMTGGATAAVAVEAGDTVTVRYQSLGSLSMRVV